MKASQDYLPCNMIFTILVPNKYIASTVPYLMLCMPYSYGFIFEFCLHSLIVAYLIQAEISACLIALFEKSLTAKFDFVLWAFDRNEITHYYAFTGQRSKEE